MSTNYRLTLPIETGMDQEIFALMERIGVDAVRNSDGTELPEWVVEAAVKVYSTYFPARGDEEWAEREPQERVRQYLMSTPVTATDDSPLEINVMKGYFTAQFCPDLTDNVSRYWQIIDRTTGQTISPEAWEVRASSPLEVENPVCNVGDLPVESGSAVVILFTPEPFHVYTVNFLAKQIWDSTQMYNYLTNNWAAEEGRVKERPYDVSYPATWHRTQAALRNWLEKHHEVDVVRFTTFFYHFTLVFDDRAREKYVDWFGYSAAVSVPALEAFEKSRGYALTPEDFIDAGYYNSPFRVPTPAFRDWIDFTSQTVAEKAGELVRITHQAGREAMMFLGDNWIGLEPYGPYFPTIGLDAVVGSVGSAATCRMISDIPGISYTEGRFLPYFFPDVFNEQGDPVGEANSSWATARRAIVRHPLDRIGYGGYLSLAVKFPAFVDRIEEIIGEFRSLHDETEGNLPENAKIVVGVVNAWGKLRSWQTHMVAHALWYKQIYSYLGVVESLAGLPFEVRFISFGEIIDDKDALRGVNVVINAGAIDTAFSGGCYWDNPLLQERLRRFVWEGGGFIGVGDPTAHKADNGSVFALADVLGVDREKGWSLSTDRYLNGESSRHFVCADLGDDFEFGEDPGDTVVIGDAVKVLRESEGSVRLSVNQWGKGRAVYLAGLPYTTDNARLLHRAVVWAGGAEAQWEEIFVSSNPAVDVAWYSKVGKIFVYNNTTEAQSTVVSGRGGKYRVSLPSLGSLWLVVT